jgi:hypothetical protein
MTFDTDRAVAVLVLGALLFLVSVRRGFKGMLGS